MTKLWAWTLATVVIALVSFTERSWAAAPTEKAIYAFKSGTDGSSPRGSLVFDSSGNLFGTTEAGGAGNAGTVFELTRTSGGWSEAIVYSFQGGTDGDDPNAGLVIDGAGNLYGTTVFGGAGSCAAGCGTVFELTPQVNGGSWTESVLYSFQGDDDGAHPYSGVILDKFGNLYGTASVGGNLLACPTIGGCGTVFELSSASGSWTKTTLHTFQGGTQDGASPNSGLTIDGNGHLYGATSAGGIDNVGLVYELYTSNGNWSEKVLHVFTGDCARGCNPESTLVFNGMGYLVGTVQARNSSFCCGIVLALVPSSGGTWIEKVVFRFNSPTNTIATPVFDAQGNYYDTSSLSGRNGSGRAYRLHWTKGGVTATFFGFCSQYGCPDGAAPSGGVILDGSGNLYGTASFGGLGYGVVYEITP